jgi:two-component system sensor histidine kinase and response regulator WspE
MTSSNGIDFSDMSMMDLFRMEAENQCNQISEDLIALEQDPSATDLLESLMRASHSVKGAARVVDLHPAVQVAHAMEDVFVAAQENKLTLAQDGIDLLLRGVDLLNSISQVSDDETDAFFEEKAEDINSLVNSFAAFVKGEKPAASSAAETKDDTPPPAKEEPDILTTD